MESLRVFAREPSSKRIVNTNLTADLSTTTTIFVDQFAARPAYSRWRWTILIKTRRFVSTKEPFCTELPGDPRGGCNSCFLSRTRLNRHRAMFLVSRSHKYRHCSQPDKRTFIRLETGESREVEKETIRLK